MNRPQPTEQAVNHDAVRRERRRMDSGVRLSLALAKHNVTVRHLAACAGVSESKVKRIQEGVHALPLDLVPLAPRGVALDLLTHAAEQAGLGVHETIDSNEDCVNAVETILSMDKGLVRRLMGLRLNRGISPEDAPDLRRAMVVLASSAQAIIRLCDRSTVERRTVSIDEEPR
jgi:hypothetical protein